MPLVSADYDPKKTFFALDLETFAVASLAHAPEFAAWASVEAIVTRRRKDLGINTFGNGRIFFELHADTWGHVKVADFTLDDLMDETHKGRLSHSFLMDWDGKVLDTFGRRVSLDEVTTMAGIFEPLLRALPNAAESQARLEWVFVEENALYHRLDQAYYQAVHIHGMGSTEAKDASAASRTQANVCLDVSNRRQETREEFVAASLWLHGCHSRRTT